VKGRVGGGVGCGVGVGGVKVLNFLSKSNPAKHYQVKVGHLGRRGGNKY